MQALTKSKAFDPRFTTMTNFSKKVSLEGPNQQVNQRELDEAMYLNRLLHDTRRKAQSVLKTKQIPGGHTAPGGTALGSPQHVTKLLDAGSHANRANSMLDQIDNKSGNMNSHRNPNMTTGNFSFTKTFRPFGTDVVPGYTLKQPYDNEEDYSYSPFKNKLRKQLFINGQPSSEMYKSAMQPQTMSTIQSQTGLEDKAKKILQNNRDNLGVWDAIAIADAQRYKMEQNEKRKTLRKKHIELQNFYVKQAQDKRKNERMERDRSIAEGQNIVNRDLMAVEK